MTLRRFLSVGLLLLITSTAAYAKQLASSNIYGGPSQDHATCIVTNVGTVTVSSLSVRIFDQNGTNTTDTDLCLTSLAPGQTCSAFANFLTTQAYSCSVETAGSVKNLRGTLEIRSTSPTNVLRWEELR
jgi:hypothetical protein